MPETVNIDGKEWSLEGLPRHMVAGFPLTTELTTERRLNLKRGEARIVAEAFTGKDGNLYERSTETVQLERDGVPLTLGDRQPSWLRGEAEGFRPTRFDPPPPSDEVIDVDGEECE